jgi:hypothetical protein
MAAELIMALEAEQDIDEAYACYERRRDGPVHRVVSILPERD